MTVLKVHPSAVNGFHDDVIISDPDEIRRQLLIQFHETFSLYQKLHCECVTEEGHFVRADPLRHPLIFYFGHTAAFYVNKLILAKLISFRERIDPKIESLVAVGVDEMSWDDLPGDNFNWPSFASVLGYREKVRDLVDMVIRERLPLEPGSTIGWDHPAWTILMGIDHERIHLETSSVLIRQLDLKFIKDCRGKLFEFSNIHANLSKTLESIYEFKEVEGAKVKLGRGTASSATASCASDGTVSYGWDNEYGLECHLVEGFSAGTRLVSNQDFFHFVADHGYSQERYWSVEGWNWVTWTGSKFPKFWRSQNGSLENQDNFKKLRLMLEEIDFRWDFPVEVNCLEASAYCRWFQEKKMKVGNADDGKEVRLPTEAEYQLLHSRVMGQIMDGQSNIKLSRMGPNAVNEIENGNGFYDIVGNVWQWTRTPMYPFKGFTPHPLYDDFTMPCFDDRHNLIKGGSWISTGNEANVSCSRYAFRRHFFQHAGFRMVMGSKCTTNSLELNCDFDPKNSMQLLHGSDDNDSNDNPYETDALVSQYCEFHYGPRPIKFFPDSESFPIVIARICEALAHLHLDYQQQPGMLSRVLDLGCAVGRTSFELAKTFDQVVGIDFSARFIQVGSELQDSLLIRYSVPIEGDIMAVREYAMDEAEKQDLRSDCKLVDQVFGKIEWKLPLLDCASRDRVQFFQGDACNLSQSDPRLFGFDVVLAANLIDRLYDPAAFLTTIHERINDGGFLVILSPYTWLPDYTPKESWIGARRIDGENVTTLDALEQILEPWFDLFKISSNFDDQLGKSFSFHVPMIIRETERKFQHTFSECSIWRKRN